ncbi:MAG: DUF6273 domain-containing protein [Bacilli bacterium]
MKNKLSNLILIIIILLLCTFIVFFSINYLDTDKKVVKSGKETKQSSSNSLALMLETAISSGEYQVSTDSTWPATGYDFNPTLSKCENGSTLTYDIVTKKVKVQSNRSDKCFVYFDKEKPKFYEYLISNNGIIGMDYHISTLPNGANDNSYRFSGANPNNYVCFGPGATVSGQTCPDNNIYRIIGVFGNQVKLIKKASLGNRVWNSNNVNTWAGSTMDTYLNGEYLNNLTSTWSNKIVANTWQVGGMTDTNGSKSVPAIAYNYEVGPNKANVTFNAKIGLMYVSDYGFASSPSNWTLTLYNYNDANAKANNWLYSSSMEWIMSRTLDNSSNAFDFTAKGYVSSSGVTGSFGARAVFFLQSSVNLNGGNGTAIDPYRILQ